MGPVAVGVYLSTMSVDKSVDKGLLACLFRGPLRISSLCLKNRQVFNLLFSLILSKSRRKSLVISLLEKAVQESSGPFERIVQNS